MGKVLAFKFLGAFKFLNFGTREKLRTNLTKKMTNLEKNRLVALGSDASGYFPRRNEMEVDRCFFLPTSRVSLPAAGVNVDDDVACRFKSSYFMLLRASQAGKRVK